MALLNNLSSTDQFDVVQTKIDDTIDTVNLIAGGTTGQLLSKLNGDDFNTTWVDPPVLKFAVVNIGDWNMDSTDEIEVDISAYANIRMMDTIILSDAGAPSLLLRLDTSNGQMQGGYGILTSSIVRLRRLTGGAFDNTNYNSTSFNRGYITVGYLG